jgi:2-polyprenyl-3-methyl-5-hydroxy-6-metoxy-1,4-benzoquinol methylase
MDLLQASPASSENSPSDMEQRHTADSTTIELALSKRIDSWIVGRGELSLPCAPALTDNYMQRLTLLFSTMGKSWSEKELEQLRQLLARKLEEGFRTSPHSRLIVRYESEKFPSFPTIRLSVSVSILPSSLEDQYKKWTQTREPPLFGSHPDAKVMAVAAELGDPKTAAILDVGAGTGRNTLPLARLGHPVQAIELAPAFVQQLVSAVQIEGLPVMVTQADVLNPQLQLPPAHYKLAIVVEVVSHFRSVQQLKQMLAKMCATLRPGGLLLFNTFLAAEDYDPNQLVREMSELAWSSIFTRGELTAASEGLPLELVSDESVFEYERQHLPAEAWPPTGWFNQWATGRDLFPVVRKEPPMELRWLLYRRQ